MFAVFNEIPARTFQYIKETKRYGRADGRTDARRANSKPSTKFARGGGGKIMEIDLSQ